MRRAWSVAGVTLALSGDDVPPVPGLKHELFATSAPDADLALTLSKAPVPAADGLPLLFDSGGVWKLYGDATRRLYHFESHVFSPRLYKGLLLDAGYTKGTLFWPGVEAPLHPLDSPLEQVLFTHRLAHEGAVELHCVGLVVDGRALLLCGQSGVGKSTSAKLWRERFPDVEILSDDRVVLKRDGEGWRAWGTPWHGEGAFASASSAPLAGLVLLRHGATNRLHDVSPVEAARELYRLTFPPVWEAEGVNRVLDSLASIVQTTRARRFEFVPDVSAVDVVAGAAW